MPARELARLRLEAAHHLEALADVGFGQRHHLRAAIGLQRHQALGGEQPQRLAQRRARHAQPLAQRALVQTRPRRELAFGDEIAQVVRDAGRQRRAVRGGRQDADAAAATGAATPADRSIAVGTGTADAISMGAFIGIPER